MKYRFLEKRASTCDVGVIAIGFGLVERFQMA
jgi:hypothetical protein